MANVHWQKVLMPAGATLRQVIRCLDESGMQIVIVVDDDCKLLGTVTDGDIRRGLLRGMDLESVIDGIVHRDALVAPPQMGRDMALQLMQANVISALPVVDSGRKVVGLFHLSELLEPCKRPNIMVIMAGGRGIRLLPHTENCPKPLLPVGDKPMLQHILERAHSDGFEKFVLSVHYLGHMIEEYFGNGDRFGVQIEYLRESEPLGTAGALSLLDSPQELPMIVSNGDVLTDIRYGELIDFHGHQGATATMAVRLHEWQHPFGVVRINGVDIVGFEEKPISRSHINAGVYALSPQMLQLLKKGEHCDMPSLFGRAKDAGLRTIVYPMHEPWLDIGRPHDLESARKQVG